MDSGIYKVKMQRLALKDIGEVSEERNLFHFSSSTCKEKGRRRKSQSESVSHLPRIYMYSTMLSPKHLVPFSFILMLISNPTFLFILFLSHYPQCTLYAIVVVWELRRNKEISIGTSYFMSCHVKHHGRSSIKCVRMLSTDRQDKIWFGETLYSLLKIKGEY